MTSTRVGFGNMKSGSQTSTATCGRNWQRPARSSTMASIESTRWVRGDPMRRSQSRYFIVAAALVLAATGVARNRLAAALGAADVLRARFGIGGPVSAEPFCPGGRNPSPNVVLCDNFEDNGFERRWDIGG